MPPLRHAIERYYLSIFIISLIVMSILLVFIFHSLAIKRIDQEILVFANDLLRFLEKPESQPVAIFGKKNYAFYVTEEGKIIASYNLPDDFRIPKSSGFHTIGYYRYFRQNFGEYQAVVARSLKDHFTLLVSLCSVLTVVLIPLILIVLFFGRKLTRKLTQPIEMIGEQMQLVSKGVLERISIEPTSQEAEILQKQLNDAIDRLNKVMEELRDFATTISHQLRNPLASAKTRLEVLLREELTGNVRFEIERVKHNIDRMVEITSQLLLIARVQHTTPKNFQEEDLSSLILESLDQIAAKYSEREIIFNELKQIKIKCVGPLLIQAFANLLDNACKYSNSQKPILLNVEEHKDSVIVEVCNHGEPVPEQDRDKIFLKFYRSSNVTTEGLGLGLAVVKAIADLHKAQVYYKYETGLNKFGIILPK
ncbi:HAMP domain-containing sensor histidine kinase [Pseudothermotoga sp.]|nr:HAMP domain-containing histidine kinase [Pseudothermotoga sp.]MCX7813786.1 HAMP domain-containing histidine kinase [Pseudothermotoga sp.]MDW8140604.1 HAMP domain-containing sensor histidine kinase [Pseudothermotoga sp.]